jgi:BarH-like
MFFRTKWKRQTAVGLELLAEAGNYAAFQRLYGTPPFTGAWPYAAQGPPGTQPSAADIYYRQAAVAALQKPHPYRMYPDVHPSLGALSAMAGQNTPFQHLSAFSSLSSLSNLYHHNANSSHNINNPSSHNAGVQHPHQPQHQSPARSPSPTLDPGSPPGRSNHSHASDDEETIQV